MTETQFIEKNESNWKALEDFNYLVKKAGIKNLSASEVKELAHLFRLASHHIAFVKTHYPSSHILPYLNRLVGVTHNYFYVRESKSFSDIISYFTHIFPHTVRETWRYTGIATVIFFIGLFFAAFYVAADFSRLYDILPPAWSNAFDTSEVPDWGDGAIDIDYAYFAASVTTNNIAVSFNAVAGGLLAGLGTLYIMVINGMLVGGLFGFFHASGADMVVAYALVLPHGIIELAAIFICGGAGLMLAKGLLIPGNLTRKESIVCQTKKVATLIPGIVAMLIIAGIIEGYVTPLPIDPWLKNAFAAFTGFLLVIYFTKRTKHNKIGLPQKPRNAHENVSESGSIFVHLNELPRKSNGERK